MLTLFDYNIENQLLKTNDSFFQKLNEETINIKKYLSESIIYILP